MMNETRKIQVKTFDLKEYDSIASLVLDNGKLRNRASMYHGIPIEHLDTVKALMLKYKKSGDVVRYRFRGPRVHRKGPARYNTYFKKVMVPHNSNNTQSMCHRADAKTFAVYCYQS